MFNTVDDVRQLAADVGYHWFSPETMRFFNSRIGRTVYGGQYFVSSERYDDSAPRLYTIRKVTYDDGQMSIDTVGEFQQYDTRVDAVAAIRQIVEG